MEAHRAVRERRGILRQFQLLSHGRDVSVQVVPLQVDVFREADAWHIAPVEEGVGCRRDGEQEEGGGEDESCGEVCAQSGFGED